MIFLNIFKSLIKYIFPEKKYKKIKNELFFLKNQKLFFIIKYQENKKLIFNFKYKAEPKAVKILTELMYDNIFEILNKLEKEEKFYNPILIHIPGTKFDKIKKGFHHNELILKNFFKKIQSKDLKWEKNILIKKRNIKKQSKLKNKKEREKNIKNIFKIKNKEKIKNKNIIIFDDIYTTGSTLKEAERELKKAGAKKIFFITLAH